MKLEYFRYLLEVNRLHSISAAARSLHVRQTTLSAVVKNVEDELGYPIFQRTPSGVSSTPLGEQFLALAWEINIQYEELLRLRQRAAEGVPTVQLLLPGVLASCLPITLSRRFYQFELQGNLSFQECLSLDVSRRVADGSANLGLAYLTEESIRRCHADLERNALQMEVLLHDRIYMIVTASHRLAGRKSVDMDELVHERLATAKGLRDDAILGQRLLNWERFSKFNDVDLMKQAVLEQNMIGFQPGYSLISEGNTMDMSKFWVSSVCNTERENRLQLCLIHRAKRALGYQEKILASCITSYFESFREAHPNFGEEGGLFANGTSL